MKIANFVIELLGQLARRKVKKRPAVISAHGSRRV
jgi:hypothetical protein